MPTIAEPIALASWFDREAEGYRTVVLATDASTAYGAVLRQSVPHFVVIGPEGGFTPSEIDHARRRGAILARLGPTVLRAETAALAALAAVAAYDRSETT